MPQQFIVGAVYRENASVLEFRHGLDRAGKYPVVAVFDRLFFSAFQLHMIFSIGHLRTASVLGFTYNVIHMRRFLANAYIEKKQYLKAINELEDFLERFPKEKEGYFLLGRAYFHLGMIQKAQMAFEKCVAYFPNHGYAHRNLMMIYSILGDEEKTNKQKQILKRLGVPIE